MYVSVSNRTIGVEKAEHPKAGKTKETLSFLVLYNL